MSQLRQYTAENLLVHPSTNPQDPDLILTVTPESAGWDFISFQARQISAGAESSFNSNENELAIILLSGGISVRSTRGSWQGLERKDVWTSAATTLYLPSDTAFTVLADRDSEIAVTRVPS
ncbi:MAG TPA: 5-deoxy-glucuronate isomerase [Anaerolineales bacterium]|nr:5-deoxy-glucuronate isomerase [Anaerolineales bacterium]